MKDFSDTYIGRNYELLYDGMGGIEVYGSGGDYAYIPVSVFKAMVDHFKVEFKE